jgi:hypothetical protein
MATRRYSINPGDLPGPVTENAGIATVNKSVEVTVDLAAVSSKNDVLVALTKISDWITQGNWPPA